MNGVCQPSSPAAAGAVIGSRVEDVDLLGGNQGSAVATPPSGGTAFMDRFAARVNEALKPLKALATGANVLAERGIIQSQGLFECALQHRARGEEFAKAAVDAAEERRLVLQKQLEPHVRALEESARCNMPETIDSAERAGTWVSTTIASSTGQSGGAGQQGTPMNSKPAAATVVGSCRPTEEAGV
mmetsp:Transcript_28008/g.55050  ORF Transcript_28008/g.55050 Transcript_28008/m.55050 type:complete len:186 (+) Transcript_28008:44-601(+)